jgi:hypothetical protein
MERPDRPPRIHRITRGKNVYRSLLRTGVLTPLAALAVLAAAPAQARTGDGGQAAAPASSASSASSAASDAAAVSVASGGPVTPATAPPPARTAPAETGLDLGVSRVMRRCDATARSALRDATATAAGGTHAAAAAHRGGVLERPPADLRARRAVPDPARDLIGAATKQVSGVGGVGGVGGVRGALNGQAEDAAKEAAKQAAAPGAPLEALPSAGRARAADCAAAAPDQVRRLTGPVPGALFAGSPGPGGVIPERSLS